MRKRPKHTAPEGFIRLLREGMEKRKISLNQLAERAHISPAFLSRTMNKERGLPSDTVILRLAKILDLQPHERLLIEAGRVPKDLQSMLAKAGIPELWRATGELSEDERQQVLKTVQALAVNHRRKGKRA